MPRFPSHPRGGIGRRARLRALCPLRTCWFDSSRGYITPFKFILEGVSYLFFINFGSTTYQIEPKPNPFRLVFKIPQRMSSNSASALKQMEAEKLERIAYILKTVAHPLRLGIVNLLEQHEHLSVSEICESLGSEQSLTSHHLQNMRLKGILSVKRQGRSMLYSLKERDVSLIIKCLENCQCNM